MNRTLAVTSLLALLHVAFSQLELVHSWSRLDFDFRTEAERNVYLQNAHYESCVIAGIKLDSKGNIYVSIPRWRPNVPVTLAMVNNNTKQLMAFPSWEMNDANDGQNAIQSVLGFEIDALDRMWILDQGRVNDVPGVPKVIVWDLQKNESVGVHIFNETVAPPTTAFLNDIVVNTADNLAYISDSGIPIDPTKPAKPALIMFDLDDNAAVRHLEDQVSTRVDDNVWLTVNEKKCFEKESMKTGMDGIALSCDNQRLYWTPLTSRRLYGLETDTLLMYDAADPAINASVVDLGDKISSSDGLLSSSQRELFITALETNSIYALNEKQIVGNIQNGITPPKLDLPPLVNDSRLIWPDTMSISDGYLYVVSNNLCEFLQGHLDWKVQNFMIYRVRLPSGASSYVNGCDAATINFGIVEIVLMSSGAVLFVASIVIVLAISARKKRVEGSYDELK